MDTCNLKMGKEDGVQRVAEVLKKLCRQKPSQKLINALRKVKEQEDITKNKKAAMTRNAET